MLRESAARLNLNQAVKGLHQALNSSAPVASIAPLY